MYVGGRWALSPSSHKQENRININGCLPDNISTSGGRGLNDTLQEPFVERGGHAVLNNCGNFFVTM